MDYSNKNKLLGCLVVIYSILFISCAANKPPALLNRSPEFEESHLTGGGIALFPVFIGKDCQFTLGVEKCARIAGEKLAADLKMEESTLKVISPVQVDSILAANDLFETFSELKQTYMTAGSIDFGLVKEIIKPFEVQFFLFTSIDSLTGTENISYKPQADIKMSGKVYNINSSEMVFDVVVKEQEVAVMGSYPYEEVTKKACDVLVSSLFLTSISNSLANSKLSFGLLAGRNFAQVHTADPLFKPSSESGNIFSATAQLHLKGLFYLQPEVQYLKRKAKFTPVKSDFGIIRWEYDFIEIPVLIQIKPKPRVRKLSHFISAGPSFCFNLNNSTKITSGMSEVVYFEEKREKTVMDIAFVFGSGFEYHYHENIKISVKAEYSWGMYSMTKYDTWKYRTIKLIGGFLFNI